MLFGWQSVQAQSTVLSSQMPAGIEKTIIRELKYPMSISYVETLTEHCFVLYDGTNNPLSLIRIDANIFVNDFVIEDDTVFFCGRNSLNNQGVFGHFHINYFYNATYSYSYITSALSSVNGVVSTFEKMVTYTESGCRILAAVGKTLQGNYVVAEVRYYSTLLMFNYRIGAFLQTNPESILDITLTDNHVVTAGFYVSGQDVMIGIRAYSRNSMFSVGGIQDTAVLFKPISNDFYCGDQLVLSHKQADDFSISTYTWNITPTVYRGTNIGIYSVGSNGYISNNAAILAVQNFQNGSWHLCGMTPDDVVSHFYLLQNAEVSGYNYVTSMVLDLDASCFALSASGATKPIRVLNDYLFRSIDGHYLGAGFVSNGYRRSDTQYLGYYNSTYNPSNCHVQESIMIYPMYLKGDMHCISFDITTGNGQNFLTKMGTTLFFPKTVDCVQ